VAKVWAIVVAGGSGRRFGEPKQFASLAGRPVVSWAVDACRAQCDGVVLVVPEQRAEEQRAHDKWGADDVVAGGDTRTLSVRHGLVAVPADAELIVVHDAARPLASPELFHAVLDALRDETVDAAIPGVAVHDTIKQVDPAGLVTATLDRDALVAVQTPQAFRAEALRRAHELDDGRGATDDAALVESSGGAVRVVPGDPRNAKITTPEDLRAAESLVGAGLTAER